MAIVRALLSPHSRTCVVAVVEEMKQTNANQFRYYLCPYKCMYVYIYVLCVYVCCIEYIYEAVNVVFKLNVLPVFFSCNSYRAMKATKEVLVEATV